jgi:hypothetical protein
LNLLDAARRLRELGHAPEFADGDNGFFEWVLKDLGQQLITRYQTYHGLAATGKLDAETEEHLEICRCQFPDRMAVTAESRWAETGLCYFLEFTHRVIDSDELAADYAEAIRRIMAVCGVEISRTQDPARAQVLAGSGPIDGPWNVLALTELPPPGATVGTVLHQKFDIAELALTREQRIGVMTHEACHFLGLGHALPGVAALMAPGLGAITTPQAWDIAELQARYGPPRPPVATLPGMIPGRFEEHEARHIETLAVDVPETGPFEYIVKFDGPGRYVLVVVHLR